MPVDYTALQAYLEKLVPARHPELGRMEAYAKENDFPILGPASCQFCYLLTRLTGARKVFEMGSGYGYSTAWFARGVEENGGGLVHHTVWNQDLSDMAKKHLSAMGFSEIGSDSNTQISYVMGEAIEALRNTDGPFDIIFNDIDKDAYPDTIDLAYERLKPGGLFITDNVVWGGRVTEPSPDETTQRILEFTRTLSDSPKWDCSIVPIRDGLMVAVKR